MKTELKSLFEDIDRHWPYTQGSLRWLISDQYDLSVHRDLEQILCEIGYAFKFVYGGSSFRFHDDWIVEEEGQRSEEAEIAEACRVRMITRMCNLFVRIPGELEHAKIFFLDDLFVTLWLNEDLYTFFNILKVSGKALDLFKFRSITKKCPRRIVEEALDLLSARCKSQHIIFLSLQSPYEDVIEAVISRVLYRDKSRMKKYLMMQVVPRLRELPDGPKKQILCGKTLYDVKADVKTIIFIIEQQINIS